MFMCGKNGVFWITVSLTFILALGSIAPVLDFDDNDLRSTAIGSEPERGVVYLAGTPHAPIVIDGDTNFSDTAVFEGWPGDGSAETPYIIDGFDIDPGVVNSHCISVQNTRVNFTIINCNLTGADTSFKSGISMWNVTNGVLINNIFKNNYYDIRLFESYSILIKNNTCTDSTSASIDIDDSSNNIITDNNCIAISLNSNSDFNTIANNTCNSIASSGIFVDGTSNTVVNNTCSGHEYDGIYLDGSYNTAANNTCTTNAIGVTLDGSYNIAANNTCIDNDYGVWIMGWQGTATTNNCTSNDCGIVADGTSNMVVNNTCNSNANSGIESMAGNLNTVIDNTCNDNFFGILAIGDSNDFIDNTCSHNSDSGIVVSSSNPCSITNNTCTYNYYFGIYITSSNPNLVMNNTCNYNGRNGIHVEMSNPQSVTNNTCNYNSYYGIFISSSDSNTVANNSCNYNIRYGIFIDTSNLNTLTNNTFTNNQVGIYIEGFSSNNNILWNTLIDNLDNGYNGPDGVNLFDYNYWSDYAGNDTDLNGVGDTPYLVSMGFEPFYDYHPLMNPPGYFEWTQLPTDQQLLLGEPLRYDLNVTVYGGPDYWWINDTLNFAIDESGVITNNTFLLAQNYGLQVFVNATYGSILSGVFTVSIEDWFSPSWLEEPVNQIVEYGTSLNYEMNAIDPSGLDIWWLNDTLHFTVDDTGLATTIGVVPVGAYTTGLGK